MSQRYKPPKRRDNRLTALFQAKTTSEVTVSQLAYTTDSELENSAENSSGRKWSEIMVGDFFTISWSQAEHFLHRSSPCSIRTIEHYLVSGLESAFRPCGKLLPLFTRSHTSWTNHTRSYIQTLRKAFRIALKASQGAQHSNAWWSDDWRPSTGGDYGSFAEV